MNFKKNLFKVGCGYFCGIPLLALISELPIYVISAIQVLYFTLFYALIDYLIEIKEKRKNAWMEKEGYR